MHCAACPGKDTSAVRLINRLDMTIAVDWDVKPNTKQNAKLDSPVMRSYYKHCMAI